MFAPGDEKAKRFQYGLYQLSLCGISRNSGLVRAARVACPAPPIPDSILKWATHPAFRWRGGVFVTPWLSNPKRILTEVHFRPNTRPVAQISRGWWPTFALCLFSPMTSFGWWPRYQISRGAPRSAFFWPNVGRSPTPFPTEHLPVTGVTDADTRRMENMPDN